MPDANFNKQTLTSPQIADEQRRILANKEKYRVTLALLMEQHCCLKNVTEMQKTDSFLKCIGDHVKIDSETTTIVKNHIPSIPYPTWKWASKVIFDNFVKNGIYATLTICTFGASIIPTLAMNAAGAAVQGGLLLASEKA